LICLRRYAILLQLRIVEIVLNLREDLHGYSDRIS
jgi:hypothetical protein